MTFPKLGGGKEHYHVIEMLTLKRQDHQTLVLAFTPEYSERFERVDTGKGAGRKTIYRLTQANWPNKFRLTLSYAHEASALRHAPSELVSKHSQAIVISSSSDGPLYAQNGQRRIAQEKGYGLTLYGWDGNLLAWESKVPTATSGADHHTTHYLCEPGSFVPLLQTATDRPIRLPVRSKINAPWEHTPAEVAADQAFTHTAYYHCDHLGTPQELTEEAGNLVWSAHYKAWGEAQELISTARRKAGLTTNIRFQGQYFDHETGLHYNRYRYYDPHTGRFVSKDPVGLSGGMNIYQYVPSPTLWIDPRGLTAAELAKSMIDAGETRPANTAAHHIVGENSVGAQPARDVLNKHNIDINSEHNGVFLPNKDNKDSSVPGIRHCGRHPDKYLDRVNRRIQEADRRGGKQGVLDELADMKRELSTADRNASWSTVLGH